MKSQTDRREPPETARAVYYASGLISLISLSILLLYGVQIAQAGDAAPFRVPLAAAGLLLLAGLTAAWHSRRGRAVRAVHILLGALWLAAPAMTIIVDGIGLALGIVLTIVTAQVSLLGLPQAQLRWRIGGGILVGALTILLDLFWPGSRLTIPMVSAVVPVAGSIAVLLLGFQIARTRFAEFSIGTKLALGSLLVTAVSGLVLIFFVIRSTTNLFTARAGEDLNNLASTQALAVGELLGRQTDILQLLSFNQQLRDGVIEANQVYDGDEAAIRQLLAQGNAEWESAEFTDEIVEVRLERGIQWRLSEFKNTFPNHRQLLVTDQHGALIGSTSSADNYLNADEPWWQAAFNDGGGGLYIGLPQRAANGQLMVDLAVPVYNSQAARVVGVLKSSYRLDDLRDLLAAFQAELGLNTSAELLLPNDQVVNFTTGTLAALSPTTLSLLNDTASMEFAEFAFEGQPELVSQALVNTLEHVPVVDSLGWRMVVHQERGTLAELVAQQRQNLVLLGLAILLVTAVAATYWGRWLTDPVVQLTETAGRIQAGDLTVQAAVNAQDEVGRLATSFNTMTARLRDLIGSLEQRVADRTRALTTSTEVSRRLATILDRDVLLREVVEQVQSAFNYYHAHIYLFDAPQEKLLMVGGTGSAGQQMLANGHFIQRGKGLVGRAADTGTAVLVPDVSQAADWLPNPLLPETRAEAAVPIVIGDNVLGVLDVQQNQVNGLGQQDIDLLQAIAYQVAIALRNIRLVEETQERARREALINEISQKILRTGDMQQAMQVAVRELGQLTGADMARIRLQTNGQPQPPGPSDQAADAA